MTRLKRFVQVRDTLLFLIQLGQQQRAWFNALEMLLHDWTLMFKESVLNTEARPILVGGGTDGASVSVGVHNGMRAIMQEKLPWLYWAWYFSHRLELACKDAFTSSLFSDINDILLQLYYLYHKSPKKTQELMSIYEDLKEFFCFPKGGTAPVRCQGTRWITFKCRALQRVLDRYGAYIHHLVSLVNDSSVKPVDKAKFQGYLCKWSEAQVLIGCALYVDLKSSSLVSLSLQEVTG